MAVTLDEELRKAGEPRRLGNEQAMKGKRLRPQRQVQEPPSKCVQSFLNVLRRGGERVKISDLLPDEAL